ncbi:MAG: secretion protein HlyD family protein [Proteobacteria bacterium]|nr:secretion protein HlyD family protein [Pseudomonadota bacterium]
MSAWRPLVIAGLAAAGLGFSVIWAVDHPEPLMLQGEVEATRVDLAARVAGRVVRASVDVGDRVSADDLVIELDSPALRAGLDTSKATLAVARSNRDLAFSTRQETIDARQAEREKAEADVVLAQKTYDRVSQLQERSFASEQVLDEASNKLNATLKARAAAEANLQLAVKGNSPEQKAVAVAQVEQAAAAAAQIETDLAELAVKAPMAGEVTARMAEVGELFGAGTPLLSIVDVDNAWFTFNVREDLLNGLAVGDRLKVRVPALGGHDIETRVTVINAQGSYANWRATKATGDFDLRTFEVRARPDGPIEGLRPGMSGLIDWSGPRLMDR